MRALPQDSRQREPRQLRAGRTVVEFHDRSPQPVQRRQRLVVVALANQLRIFIQLSLHRPRNRFDLLGQRAKRFGIAAPSQLGLRHSCHKWMSLQPIAFNAQLLGREQRRAAPRERIKHAYLRTPARVMDNGLRPFGRKSRAIPNPAVYRQSHVVHKRGRRRLACENRVLIHVEQHCLLQHRHSLVPSHSPT